jgi:hypothetical protein
MMHASLGVVLALLVTDNTVTARHARQNETVKNNARAQKGAAKITYDPTDRYKVVTTYYGTDSLQGVPGSQIVAAR